MSNNKIYILEFRADNCEATGTNNGFPILSYSTEFKAVEAKPINPFLTKENKFRFEISPLGVADENDITNLPEFNFSIKLKEFNDGQTYTPESGTELFSFHKDDVEFNSLPIIIEHEHGIEELTTANTYLNLEPIDDETEIIDYALYLRNLFAKRDTEQIVLELKRKILDYSISYYESPAESYEEQRVFLNELFFPANVISNFEAKDLILTPYCDGKIWQISQKENDFFIFTKELEDGGIYGIKVYVSKFGDKFKVVR